MFSLFYLAKPVYGGWVSFTAHLSLKYSLPLFKMAKRTERHSRKFGYGVSYRNVSDPTANPILITAIDKNYYDKLTLFPDNTILVLHDPTELKPALLPHLRRFRLVTIRASVQTFLKEHHDLPSLFLPHPFYEYALPPAIPKTRSRSISRVDYDKHTEIILEANQLLIDPIRIHGAVNRQYLFVKKLTTFDEYYDGTFEKSFDELTSILGGTKYCIDMSVIKNDGGGSQYTFLEAMYQGAALILNRKWIDGHPTAFLENENCFAVNNGAELAALLRTQPETEDVVKAARKLLTPHLAVDWVKELRP